MTVKNIIKSSKPTQPKQNGEEKTQDNRKEYQFQHSTQDSQLLNESQTVQIQTETQTQSEQLNQEDSEIEQEQTQKQKISGVEPITEPLPDHIINLPVTEVQGYDYYIDQDGNQTEAPEPELKLLTKDQFHDTFCGMFNFSSALTGLNSLRTEKHDKVGRETADTLYEIAEETEALRWLIQPENKWVQRALVLYAFSAPKIAGCRAEIAHKKAQRQKEKENKEDD